MSVNQYSFFGGKRGINIDITHRCALECPRCARQREYKDEGKKVPGEDMSMKDFKKLARFYKDIMFCGQLSDPVHHPKFIEMLEYLYENNITTEVHNASSLKSKSWYIKAFKANPNACWVFGIDGLPEQSHLYRVNQDGSKLYDIMVESKKYIKEVIWKYIIFNYNEHNLNKAKAMAVRDNIQFLEVHSSRWMSEDDPFRPSKEFNLEWKPYGE
tara:strand:+ start:137 stop:778 length:642 start_codon:yes stop_codon:yes gene_type:complete